MKSRSWLLSLSLGCLVQLASAEQEGLVKQDHVNVRGQPSLKGEVVTRLKKGEKVVILEEIATKKTSAEDPTNWFKIAMPVNTPVWINSDYVSTNNQTVSSKRLNIRSGAGENYSVVGRLEKGTAFKAIRQQGRWMEIEAPAGAYAFIAGNLVSKEGAAASPPPIMANPATHPLPPEPAPVAVPAEQPIVANVTPAKDPEVKAPVTPLETKPEPPPVAQISTPQPAAEKPSTPVYVKRIITREGIVTASYSLKSPTTYYLCNPDTKARMDFLYSAGDAIKFKAYEEARVIVTGEEALDERSKLVPVLMVQKIDLP